MVRFDGFVWWVLMVWRMRGWGDGMEWNEIEWDDGMKWAGEWGMVWFGGFECVYVYVGYSVRGWVCAIGLCILQVVCMWFAGFACVYWRLCWEVGVWYNSTWWYAAWPLDSGLWALGYRTWRYGIWEAVDEEWCGCRVTQLWIVFATDKDKDKDTEVDE